MTDPLRILTPTNAPRTAEDVVNDAATSGDVGAWTLSEATGPQWQYTGDVFTGGGDYVATDGAVVERFEPYAGNLVQRRGVNERLTLNKSDRVFNAAAGEDRFEVIGWTNRTSAAYAAIIYKKAASETQAVFLGSLSNGSNFAANFNSTDNTAFGGDTTALKVDGTTETTKQGFYNAVNDTDYHLIEVWFDASNAAWEDLQFMAYGTNNDSGGFGVTGDGILLYLGPDPEVAATVGDIEDVLKPRWYAQYPQIAPSAGGPATGDGALNMPQMSLSGVGQREIVGSGGIQMPAMTMSGQGGQNEKTGSGAITMPGLTMSGAGDRQISGSGALSAAPMTASGAGQADRQGSGAISLPGMSMSGTGRQDIDGSGAITLPGLTMLGGGGGIKSGSGALSMAGFTLSGDAERAIQGAGALTMPSMTASGAGDRNVTGSGSLTMPGITFTATATLTRVGSGALSMPPMTLQGFEELVFNDVWIIGAPDAYPVIIGAPAGNMVLVGMQAGVEMTTVRDITEFAVGEDIVFDVSAKNPDGTNLSDVGNQTLTMMIMSERGAEALPSMTFNASPQVVVKSISDALWTVTLDADTDIGGALAAGATYYYEVWTRNTATGKPHQQVRGRLVLSKARPPA